MLCSTCFLLCALVDVDVDVDVDIVTVVTLRAVVDLHGRDTFVSDNTAAFLFFEIDFIFFGD